MAAGMCVESMSDCTLALQGIVHEGLKKVAA
jgi:hypothetical protein